MYNPITKQLENIKVENIEKCSNSDHYYNLIVTGKCDRCDKTWIKPNEISN